MLAKLLSLVFKATTSQHQQISVVLVPLLHITWHSSWTLASGSLCLLFDTPSSSLYNSFLNLEWSPERFPFTRNDLQMGSSGAQGKPHLEENIRAFTRISSSDKNTKVPCGVTSFSSIFVFSSRRTAHCTLTSFAVKCEIVPIECERKERRWFTSQRRQLPTAVSLLPTWFKKPKWTREPRVEDGRAPKETGALSHHLEENYPPIRNLYYTVGSFWVTAVTLTKTPRDKSLLHKLVTFLYVWVLSVPRDCTFLWNTSI